MKKSNKNIILTSLSVTLLLLLTLAACNKSGGEITDTQTDADLTNTTTDISADNSTDTGETTTEDTTDSSTGSDWKPYDIEELSFGEMTESELEAIYQQAVSAKNNKEYQYAYGLFALLSRKEYRDSAEQEKALIAKGNATTIIYTLLNCVIGGENCSVKDTESLNGDMGYLYIGEGGTPTFIYKDNGEIKKIIPDTTLKDVVSITDHTYYYSVGSPAVYQCLKKDGTVALIYNLDCNADPNNTTSAQIIGQAEAFTKELKDVVKISVCNDGYEAMYLHSDGTVSVFHHIDRIETYSQALEKVKKWTDIVDISFSYKSAVGLKSDGSKVGEKIYPTRYYNSTEGRSNNNQNKGKTQLLGDPSIIDGTLWNYTSDIPIIYYIDNSDFEYEYCKKVIWSKIDYCIDVNGNIILFNKKDRIVSNTITGVSYVEFIYYHIFATISTEGKVQVHDYYMTDDSYEKYDVDLLSHITIDIP
ncbi:MAG: hypothetical protein UHG68_06230 [Clostridia bacterium]|nr:hypothetical protein [Clostridia bacterium]